VQCPKCSSFFTFSETPGAKLKPLARPKIRRRESETPRPNEPVRLRHCVGQAPCPNCAKTLNIIEAKRVETHAASPTIRANGPPPIPNDSPSDGHGAADSVIQVPIPKPSAAAAVVSVPMRPAPKRTAVRRPVAETKRRPALPLKWLVPAVLVLLSGALVSTAFSATAMIALPLAILGLIACCVLLVVAIRSGQAVLLTSAASVYGGLLTMTLAFAPSMLGSTYQAYRGSGSDAERNVAIPKSAQFAGEIPKRDDWFDASRFTVRRNNTHYEILGAAIGPVEYRDRNGSIRNSTDSYLVIWLRRRHMEDGRRFADRTRKQGQEVSPLEWVVRGAGGQSYPRQHIELASATPGSTRQSEVFPVGWTDEPAVFAVPSLEFDELRVEISGPDFGSKPIRFKIPKSMIVVRSTQAGKTVPIRP